MLYREMGKTGIKLSALGFGAMRLPILDGNDSEIDEERAIKMIRKSIDEGVNYLDTAWPYHQGKSEAVCAKVMKDGYREKVHIATKLPSWLVKSKEDMDHFLDEQLKRLEVDCIDFYLLHALDKDRWDTYKKNDYQAFLKEAKKAGKIKYYGFSYHDNADLFKEIVDDFDWDFVQIQFNYLDINFQAGLEGMKHAAAKGMGVVIMEPLRGGMLARENVPPEIKTIINEAPIKRTQAEWALRYVWDFPEVSIVLSGMSNEEQAEENTKIAGSASPESFSQEENSVISKLQEFYKSRILVDCTKCRYCMPCPTGVNIPELFGWYNHDSMFDDFKTAKRWCSELLKPEERASNCIECGACMEHCPQGIEIPTHMKKIAAKYEN